MFISIVHQTITLLKLNGFQPMFILKILNEHKFKSHVHYLYLSKNVNQQCSSAYILDKSQHISPQLETWPTLSQYYMNMKTSVMFIISVHQLCSSVLFISLYISQNSTEFYQTLKNGSSEPTNEGHEFNISSKAMIINSVNKKCS